MKHQELNLNPNQLNQNLSPYDNLAPNQNCSNIRKTCFYMMHNSEQQILEVDCCYKYCLIPFCNMNYSCCYSPQNKNDLLQL